ncbi:MAG TPA: hypothetical protein VF091_09965 [Gaiellaceae bacterium]
MSRLDPKDLKIEVYRSSGPDGVVERAIRVTHLPSGLTAVHSGAATEPADKAAAIAELERKVAGE